MDCAPIVIFAFNRLGPLMRLVDQLRLCKESINSDVIIYVDGPRIEKIGEAEKVRKVREYVKTISGFNSVTFSFSERNKGLGPSIIAGVTEVINKYGRVIVLEDDLSVAKGFLSYMNTMLTAYETDQRIMQISGFSTSHYTPKNYKCDIYLNRRAESWSWGTWADRWERVDWDVKDYSVLLKDRKMQRRFNAIGSDLFQMLKGYKDGKNSSWAVRFCYSMFVLNKYAICPIKSLVKNEGFGADGTNCKNQLNFYKSDFNAEQEVFNPSPDLKYIASIDKSANRFWSIPYRVIKKLFSLPLSK